MVSLSALLTVASAALACAQAKPKYFFSFGDSYSQTGFDINGAKPTPANPLGNPPLPGWTASGGLDWVGFMVTEFNASLVYSYNLAYGGATTNATIIPPYAPTVLSFIDQVKIFSDNLAAKPSYAPWTASNSVAAVWMGVNDVGNSFWFEDYQAINGRVLDSYFGQLEILYRAGLRKFVLLSVPPTEKAPAMLGNVALLKPAIDNYNSILATKLAAFKKGRSITAKIVDTHRAFNEALNNPAKYGSPDATCYNGDGKSCLWFNDYHPAVQIQRLVGAQVAKTFGEGFFKCVNSSLC
jgi:phospholipase/lecithinase/hemolysin